MVIVGCPTFIKRMWLAKFQTCLKKRRLARSESRCGEAPVSPPLVYPRRLLLACRPPFEQWVLCVREGHCALRQPGADSPLAHPFFTAGRPVANAHTHGAKIAEARSRGAGQTWRYINSLCLAPLIVAWAELLSPPWRRTITGQLAHFALLSITSCHFTCDLTQDVCSNMIPLRSARTRHKSIQMLSDHYNIIVTNSDRSWLILRTVHKINSCYLPVCNLPALKFSMSCKRNK